MSVLKTVMDVLRPVLTTLAHTPVPVVMDTHSTKMVIHVMVRMHPTERKASYNNLKNITLVLVRNL